MNVYKVGTKYSLYGNNYKLSRLADTLRLRLINETKTRLAQAYKYCSIRNVKQTSLTVNAVYKLVIVKSIKH